MSEEKRPFKRGWEAAVALFVLLGSLATVAFAVGTTWFG